MDASSIAAAMAAKGQADVKSALAAEAMKMRAQHAQDIAGMLEASVAEMKQLAASPPPGAGGNVDVVV